MGNQDEEVAAILQGWADQIVQAVLSMPEMRALAVLAWQQKQAREFGESVGNALGQIMLANPDAAAAMASAVTEEAAKKFGEAPREDGS